MTDLIKTGSHQEWLATRKSGIGGSDIGAIMGLSRFRSPYDVYLSKIIGEEEEQPENEAIHWGNVLEDVVAKEYQERTGLKVQRINATMRDGIKIANIDRAIVNPDISGTVRFKDGALTTDAILECKTAGFHSAWRWGPSQEQAITNGQPTGEAEIPIEYLAQVQWYLGITGCQTAYIAVLIGGQDFRIYRVERDQGIIEHMDAVAEQFWQSVEKGIPPEPKTAEEAAKTWPQDNGQSIEADNDTAAAFGELVSLKAKAKQLAEQIKEKEDQLKLAIGERTMLTLGGNKIATWKAGSRNTFDTKALRADHPDLAARYTKTTTTRTLRIHA